MLKQCVWGGKEYECDKLFQTRLSFDGFCCIFNYIRSSTKLILYRNHNLDNILTTARVPLGAGIENGLQLTLNNDYNDYFFTSMDTNGYMIHIFYPYDYPDKISGSLSEVIVNLGTEALISIGVDVIQSSDAMKALPLYMRNCKFRTDEKTFFGQYRDSDCYVDCKLKSMRSLCQCIPFSLPVDADDFCTLIDLPCLKRYKDRWSRYYPKDVSLSAFELEKTEGMQCWNCSPACNTVIYNVFTNTVPIIGDDNNSTYVNIFINSDFGDLLKNDVIMTWFEILSNFGGLLGLFMGSSIISLIEIIMFCYRLIQYCIFELINNST